MLEAALNTVSIGYEGANKYKVRVAHKSIVAARHCWVSPTLSRTRLTQVRDPAGRPMYFVVEDSGCCSRQCCNPNHSMTLQVTDMTGERVMTMKRPWTWNCCCCEFGNMFGCSHMDIYLGGKHDTDEEHKVGEVRMPCCGGGFKPTLNIQDKKGDTKAVVKGPCCFVSDLCGSTFEVITPDGKTVGDVQKLGIQSAGNAIQEATTDADNFLSLTQRGK